MKRIIGAAMATVALGGGALVATAAPAQAAKKEQSTKSQVQAWVRNDGGWIVGIVDDFTSFTGVTTASAMGTHCITVEKDVSGAENAAQIPSRPLEALWHRALSEASQFDTACLGAVVTNSKRQLSTAVSNARQAASTLDVLVHRLPPFHGIKAKHAGSSGGSSAATTTTAPAAPGIGSTVKLSGTSVLLQQVYNPAQGSDSFDQPSSGDYFVGVQVQITNTGSSTLDDDANSNVVVVGSDNQDYTANFSTIAECTNFNDGEYTLTPGTSISGCITFQLPDGVNPAKVQFTTDGGFGTNTAEWTVGS